MLYWIIVVAKMSVTTNKFSLLFIAKVERSMATDDGLWKEGTDLMRSQWSVPVGLHG